MSDHEGTPYIGYSNLTLGRLPAVQEKDKIECVHCGSDHVLRAADDGSTLLLFYHCGEKTYLGAIDGRQIINVKADVSGKI